MLLNIFYIIWIISMIYWFYFVIMAIGFLKKDNTKKSSDKKNHFAVIIAARNEENVIGNLVNSLKNVNYDKKLCDIYVIVNNCTDNTEKVAKESGANVILCTEKVKSKGEVLKFTFDYLKNNNEIDAYAIFDADNIVHTEFFNSMNEMINTGYSVVQGFRDTKNIYDNWITSSYAILYYIQSLFMNESRYKLGKSSFLNGTGFVVKKDVIDKYGFSPKTLTEDIEFTAMCAINDEKIGFAKDAITYDEQVTNLIVSMKQRKRWSFGTMECLKEYFPKLIKKGLKEKKFNCIDVALFYLAVLFQVLTGAASIFIFAGKIVDFNLLNINNFISFVFILIISYLIGVVLRILILKKNNKKIKLSIGGILFFDIFILSWIPVNFVCLFIKKCNWDLIKHDRNVDLVK